MSDNVIRCYLASPFFNAAQLAGVGKLEAAIESIGKLETVIESVGIQLFSVRRDGIICPPTASKAQRRAAFQQNCVEIDRSHLVVAWIDWALDPGQEVRVIQNVQHGLNVPLPPQVRQILSLGMKAAGVKVPQDKKIILLNPTTKQPDDPVPECISLGFDEKHAMVEFLSGPLNICDTGTSWESGYAYGKDVPVFTVSLLGGRVNLMLAEGIVAHASSLDELKLILSKFSEVATQPAGERYAEVVAELKLDKSYGGRII